MSSDPKNNIIELHIDITDEHIHQQISALDLLVSASKLSKQKLKDAMSKGAVWLSSSKSSKAARVLRRKNAKLKVGNQLSLYFDPSVLSQSVESPKLVSDETHYSVWNKPYGVWSQGSKWGDHCSIGRLVEQHFYFARQSYVVHRLDRAANGLIIIAHNKQAANKLSDLFATRQVKKIYRAQVSGHFITNQTVDEKIDNKTAISHISLIDFDIDNNESLVEVKIETGRKHQIRKHLASIGYPIIGDRLYGNEIQYDIDLQLSAFELQFICPIGQNEKRYRINR